MTRKTNDTVGGTPVVVTYCPPCNAALVFERVVDGRVLDFGTTGKLRHSDLVMYDRQTESWWQQFTGDAIVGAICGSFHRDWNRLIDFGSASPRAKCSSRATPMHVTTVAIRMSAMMRPAKGPSSIMDRFPKASNRWSASWRLRQRQDAMKHGRSLCCGAEVQYKVLIS
jgi:hypothetical protein